VSTTRMRNEAIAELPWASVAEHLTIVVPSPNMLPDFGLHETLASGPSTASLAVGATYVAAAPLGPPAS
jgi:hypothetical protein